MLNTPILQSTTVGFFVLLIIIFHTIADSIDPSQETKCLGCIRNVSSLLRIDVTKRCEGYYCGQFQLSYTYWAEAGKPGNNQGSRDYEKCARDRSCSEQTVRAYFKKFKRDCNNDGLIDCLDMAALHKAGPTSCSSDWFYKSRYWLAFNKTNCMSNRDQTLDNPKSSDFNDQTDLRQPVRLMKNQSLTPECLDCICDAVSGCNTSVNNCGSGAVCGPFAISQAYWKDGKKPGASWTACARTKECSSVTIKNYMEKYKRDCNGDGYITCEDYAAIHRRGPRACLNRDLLKDHYWNKFLTCRANQRPVNDVNMVKVNERTDESGNQNFLASRGDTNLFAATSPSAIDQQPSSTKLDSFRNSPSTNTPQSTIPATASGKYDSLQTLSYELTSLVLDVKEDKIHKPPHNKPSSQIYGLQKQQHHHHHHNIVTTQNNPLDVLKHETELTPEKKPESNQDYHLLSSNVRNYDSTVLHKPSDYEGLSIILVPKTPSSSSWSTGDTTTTIIPHTSIPLVITTTNMPIEAIHPAQSVLGKHHFIDSTQMNQNEELNTTNSQHTLSQSTEQVNQEAQSLKPNFSPIDQSMLQPVSGDEIDYTTPDFSFSAQGGGADRPSSFDKVVIGIVGSPDFSKSYPPVPEIVAQDKQSDQPILDNLHHQLPSKSQQKINTNHLRSPNQAYKPTNIGVLPQLKVGESLHSVTNNNQRTAPNANPSNHQQNTTNQQQQQQQEQEQEKSVDNNQQVLDSILGHESVNMSSLFEKGLNESSRIASECLECICDASSNCDTTVQCISKQREKNRCGLYMISWNQYQESDISLTSLVPLPAVGLSEDSANEKIYYECTTDRLCAEKLIHLYIEKHQKDCNNDGKIDCYDIAAIHRVGPENCNSGKFLDSQYWKDFNICYATDRLTTTVQPQASSQLIR